MHIAQDYHSDDDEERGYWILGPQEEEIRSTWRGKPLHSLVLAALLHPRATKLPAHVQVVYINSAMKVFAAACADWDETQLTKSISILRQKLPAFTQSEHLEVQERACLLRQLLAELGVLSLTWKSALDAQHQRSGVSSNALKVDTGKKNGKGSGSDAISSILDVMAAVDKESATTDEVDSQGARVAKQKFRILKAMLNEPFHPVHPKAQRKVPPPVELDLDEPFLKTSLDQLLAVSVPDKGNLSDLAFTSPYVSSSFAPSSALAGIGGGYTHYADDESDPGRNTWTDISPTTKSNTSAASTSASRLVSNTAMSANSMYYLQSNSSGMHEAQPVNPLSKLLAETFEDKKTKKGRVKRVKQRINSTEQLPAGAIDNDSDEDIPSSQHVHHKARPRRSDNGDGLDAVDLSTPLRDDETYVVMKHREVPEEVSPRNSGIDHTSKEASNDKKKKKKKSTYSLTGNLLDGIDEVPDQVRSNGRKSKTHKTDDLLGLSASSQPSIPSTATITVSNSAIVVAPPTTSVMTGGAVHLSTRNKITDSFRDLGLDDTDDSPSLLQPTLQPPQSVGFTLTSLQPYELSQDQFVDLLGKASHHWSSASIRVPYHSKTRNATKALATLLKAYTIDSESSRVSSLCARSTAGDYVCCLLKYKKDAGEVAIDIKCKSEGIDKNYSERILKIVVEAITAVTL